MINLNQDFLLHETLKKQNKMLAITIAQIFNLPILKDTLLLKIPDMYFNSKDSNDMLSSSDKEIIKKVMFPTKKEAYKTTIKCDASS